jgi:hypothetical protein
MQVIRLAEPSLAPPNSKNLTRELAARPAGATTQ